MTDKQPEALRLALALESMNLDNIRFDQIDEAAAELRRLHEVNAELVEALYNLRWAASERDKKNRIRQFDEFMDAADAALAKAQGDNNG